MNRSITSTALGSPKSRNLEILEQQMSDLEPAQRTNKGPTNFQARSDLEMI